MAQLVCTNQNCRVVLMYPRGASQVQCSVCHTINCAAAVRPLTTSTPCPCSCSRMPLHSMLCTDRVCGLQFEPQKRRVSASTGSGPVCCSRL